MANKTVKVYEYTKVEGKQKFTPVDTDKKLKISEVSKVAFWYLSWYEGTTKKWKSVGRVALSQAISAAEAKEFHQAAMNRGIATPDPTVDNNRLTIGAAMEARRTEIGLSYHKDTLVSHNDAFAEFNKWNSNGGPHRQYVDQITRQDLLTFKKYIVATGRDECTAGSKMMRINAMIKDALKLDHGKGPVTVKDARVKEDPVEIYEDDELTKFFAACNSFQKVLFKTYEKTGFRMQEVMFLEWKDINFKDRRITVRGKKIVANGKQYEFEVKAESARTIAVPTELISLLEQWKANNKSSSTLVFPTKFGQPNDKMLQACKRIAKRAGLPEESFYLHKFRASYATRLLRKGIDPETVRFLLGHKPGSDSIFRYLAPLRNDQLKDKLETALADAVI
jgi:integrase/recombinase XerD